MGRQLIIIAFTGLGVMPKTELLGGIPRIEGSSTLVEPGRSPTYRGVINLGGARQVPHV